mgnify:CR=1 FL=1
MERATIGKEVLTKEYSVKWTDISLNFGLDKLKDGIPTNQLNGELGNILKYLNTQVITTDGHLQILKLKIKWIKCLGLVSNTINVLNTRLRLMIMNMMNISRGVCSENPLSIYLVEKHQIILII